MENFQGDVTWSFKDTVNRQGDRKLVGGHIVRLHHGVTSRFVQDPGIACRAVSFCLSEAHR